MRRTIPYEMLRNSTPVKLPRSPKPPRKLKAWQGVLYFAAVLILLLVFGGRLYSITDQMLPELLIQQGFFLISAILLVKILRCRLRDVFPFKKPKGMAIGGVLILTLAAFLMADIYSILVMYFAPESLTDIADRMGEILQFPSLAIELLVTALCPAICEEAMHRGVILHSFQNSFRNKWISVILSAAIFGIFHLYPVRMFMPAVLGVLIGIIVLETGNMFYGMLLHFCYNGFLTVISKASEGLTADIELDELTALSAETTGLAVIMLGAMVPFLVWIGLWLVRRGTASRIPALIPEGCARKTILQIFIPILGIIFLGVVVILTGR